MCVYVYVYICVYTYVYAYANVYVYVYDIVYVYVYVWGIGGGVGGRNGRLRRQTNHLPSSSDARTKGSWQIRSKSTRESLIRAQLVPYRPQRGRTGDRRAQHEDVDVAGGGMERNGRETES